MNFDFGCAKALYARRLHPRMLLGPDDLERLRRQARRGLGRRLLTTLRQRVASVVADILNAPDLCAAFASEVGNALAGKAARYVRDMALIGILDGNADAVEAARRIVLAYAERQRFGCYEGEMLAYDLIYPHLSPDDRRRVTQNAEAVICRRVAEGKSHYFKHAGHNITLGTCMIPPLFCLLAIDGDPGVGSLEKERADLLLFLEATLNVIFGPDGYPAEDMGYGTDEAGPIAWLVEALRRAGIYDAYADCPGYARFGRALLHFVQPWGGSLAMTGDHPPCFWNREFLLARMATETEDRTLLWLLDTLPYSREPDLAEMPLRKELRVPVSGLSLLVLDDLKRPIAPSRARTPTAFRDRARGIVSFRGGWDADDTFVYLDGSQRSPSAQGHFHASCGHFSLSALGEYFAIASGRYNMEQNCHNVVLVDGKSGHSTEGKWDYIKQDGLLIGYSPGPFVDFAGVDSSHQYGCYWARRWLGLVKGRGAPAYVWTVEDINKANDWTEFWWQLHTSPENRILLNGQTAAIKGWRKGNHLDIGFVLPAPEAYPRPHRLALAQDIATVSSHSYISDPHERAQAYTRPAAMVNQIVFERPRLIAQVSGYNGRFMSLMIPRRKGEEPALIERLPSIDNSLAARIVFDKVEDTLIFAYEHNLLEAGGITGRGHWCVVRRDRKTRNVLRFALSSGTSLAVAGKNIQTQ